MHPMLEQPNIREVLSKENVRLRGRIKYLEMQINGLVKRMIELNKQLQQRKQE